MDAGPVNGCKVFDDRTATSATRTIAWGFPLSAADRCVDIKVGQSVTWAGNFTQYRVGPSGGDKPNPIAGFDPDAPTLQFPKAGTYPFLCIIHPGMDGTVTVVDSGATSTQAQLDTAAQQAFTPAIAAPPYFDPWA